MSGPPEAGQGPIARLGIRESLGVLSRFGRDPLASLNELAARGESAQYIFAPDMRILMLHDPALIGPVLLNHDSAFIKDRFTRNLDGLLGQGLLTSEGELWKRQRRMIAPSLSPKQITGYASSMVKRSEDFAAKLSADVDDAQSDSNPRRIDIHTALMELTLEVVVETLFGAKIDGGDGQVGGLIEQIMNDYVLLVHSWRRLLPAWLPQPVRRRIKRSSAAIDAIIERLVADKLASDLSGDDLLSRLLIALRENTNESEDAAQNAKTDGFDARLLRDELVTLFTAGHETTALTLAFSLHLLAEHPAAQARLRAEVEQCTQGGAPLTAGSMSALPFCTAVVRESMRLYPPAWAIGREATKATSIGALQVRKGDQILIAPWTMHRSENYFDEAERFRPERWLDGLHEKLQRYIYLPFGGGPRICVGNHFAMMEAVLILATLVRRLAFALDPASADRPLRFFPAVTLRPAGKLNLLVRPVSAPDQTPAGP